MGGLDASWVISESEFASTWGAITDLWMDRSEALLEKKSERELSKEWKSGGPSEIDKNQKSLRQYVCSVGT